MSNTIQNKCIEIFKAPESFGFVKKAGHYSALREYQDLYKQGDKSTILFLKISKALQANRATHLSRLFDPNIDEDKKDFSRGYLNGMSSLLINGLKHEYGATEADNVVKACIESLKSGKLNIEDLKRP